VSRLPRFASVVLDVDSTLSGVEGVDWLAALRGTSVAEQSARLTERAMNGELPIEEIYGQRLDLIRPTRNEVGRLARVYRERLAPGATRTIAALKKADVRVVLVSGGFRGAIEPVARELRVELNAVDIYWNDAGDYAGFDTRSPLTRQDGKREVVQLLRLGRPSLAVGDGSTDLGMKAAADDFVAFTGFVRRPIVVASASREVASFDELMDYVFAATT
jgi:phosphoserine phosphatase